MKLRRIVLSTGVATAMVLLGAGAANAEELTPIVGSTSGYTIPDLLRAMNLEWTWLYQWLTTGSTTRPLPLP